MRPNFGGNHPIGAIYKRSGIDLPSKAAFSNGEGSHVELAIFGTAFSCVMFRMQEYLANSPQARDIASVLHPQTNARRHIEIGPTIIARADGVFVHDDEGNRFLNSGAGLWCASLGYNNERLAKVAYDAMRTLGYYQIFRHASHGPAIDLSEKLLSIAPVPMSKVLLQCSGSEANDSAIKLVWYHWAMQDKPQKRKIISRTGSYHGTTCAAISLTGKPDYHAGFGLPFEGFIHTSAPHYYRGAKPGKSEEEFSTRLADEIEDIIVREGPDTVAAFWADPCKVVRAAFRLRQAILTRCRRCCAVMTCCLWSTRSYAASVAPAICGDAKHTASCPTSSPAPKRYRRRCSRFQRCL